MQCKNILGREADGLNDDQILAIRDWLSNLADIAIESQEKNNLN